MSLFCFFYDRMHLEYFLGFLCLNLPRPALIAMSNTRLRLRCVRAEHSMYCIAPISRAICIPFCGVIGT